MKRIIIILLLVLAGVAGAQTISRDSIKFNSNMALVLQVPKDTIAYRNRPITIGDWEDYVKDTADSIVYWRSADTLKLNGVDALYILTYEPQRRTRPAKKTFPGFIQWLTKKYKE